jgi:hypothetical protein
LLDIGLAESQAKHFFFISSRDCRKGNSEKFINQANKKITMKLTGRDQSKFLRGKNGK